MPLYNDKYDSFGSQPFISKNTFFLLILSIRKIVFALSFTVSIDTKLEFGVTVLIQAFSCTCELLSTMIHLT